MGRNLIETIMGAVVLAVAGFFLAFAYSHADLKEVKGYTISAQFTGVGGLEPGADVRINGIKVGTVSSLALDPVTFNAVVRMTIRPDIALPSDTQGSVSTEGLLGGKFVRLAPGKSKLVLADGGTLENTKERKSIEQMVGDLIFLATADQSDNAKKPAETPAPETPAPETPAQ